MHDDAWHLTIDYNFNENHAKSRQQSPRPFSSLYIMCSMCSICVPLCVPYVLVEGTKTMECFL